MIDWLAAQLSWSVGVFNWEASISSCLRSRCKLTEVAWRAVGMLCCPTGNWRCWLLMETVFSLTSIKSLKQLKCLTHATLSLDFIPITAIQPTEINLSLSITCFFTLPLSLSHSLCTSFQHFFEWTILKSWPTTYYTTQNLILKCLYIFGLEMVIWDIVVQMTYVIFQHLFLLSNLL